MCANECSFTVNDMSSLAQDDVSLWECWSNNDKVLRFLLYLQCHDFAYFWYLDKDITILFIKGTYFFLIVN